jgi:acetolactate synthase-1/2/3 large subunit
VQDFRALPPNGILVSDTGFAGIGPEPWFILPNQAKLHAPRSLGWGFPASMGAKCGAPDRPVICFIGDGGFYYHLSELETASRCGIKTVTVVNNNQCLQQCLGGINRAYGDRPGNRDEQSKFQDINLLRLPKT